MGSPPFERDMEADASLQKTSQESWPKGPTPWILWGLLRSSSTLNSSARAFFASGAPRRKASVSDVSERRRSSKRPSEWMHALTVAQSRSSAKADGVGYLAKNAEMVLCLTSQLETCVSVERDGHVVN